MTKNNKQVWLLIARTKEQLVSTRGKRENVCMYVNTAQRSPQFRQLQLLKEGSYFSRALLFPSLEGSAKRKPNMGNTD